MSLAPESDIYRMTANETTGELEAVPTPEQNDTSQEILGIIDIPENNDDLLSEIEAENQREALDYFDAMRQLENLDQEQLEQMWAEVGDKFKEIGIFTNHSEEGIDIFRERSEWASPYPISRLSMEEMQSKLNSDHVNIGGLYEDGNVYIQDRNDGKERNSAKENLASLAAGYGLGEEADTFIHEIYHGFQDLDPEVVKQYQIEVSELQDKIKAVELEAKIKNEPPYKRVGLLHELREKKKELLESRNQNGPKTKDEAANRAIVKEIHSHMFSDPTRYRGKIDSYTDESVTNAYLEMPVKRIHEKMLGTDRDSEDKDEIIRYDYMEGKENIAYKAFNQIQALRALGMNNLEIGRIISEDEFDEEEGSYMKLQEAMFQRREELGINRDQHMKIIKRYKISTILNAIRARNAVQDLLSTT
jgi:hypothetical protein